MGQVSGRRRIPVGAEVTPEGTDFRVWAPSTRELTVVIETAKRSIARTLDREDDDYFHGFVADVQPGTRYRFRLDDGREWPDPASRFQPDGPSGPSGIVDPDSFPWTDAAWLKTPRAERPVLYELHAGTFTQEGTWHAAIPHLPALADLGITAVELLPIGEFPGRFGWGYDGVNIFAPSHLYGSPDGLRQFIDAAHQSKLAVILDVVYNHFGPRDNSTGAFSPFYLSETHKGEWGAALNFDGPHSGPVREFCRANARYWIDEFHFDGLRFDATQGILDNSREHILSVITRELRAEFSDRSLHLSAENEPQHSRLIRPPQQGGVGFDALWNEDFHHVAMIAATGRREGYYDDYQGRAQEFVTLARRGFLFQGQFNERQGKPRGTPTQGLRPENFILYLQNHDQVANTLQGLRIHRQTSPARLRALTAWWLLGPGTPLFFQGQEFGSNSPFSYFCDHPEPLCRDILKGRREFLSQFASLDNAESRSAVPEPCDPANFERCKLDHDERLQNAEILALHRDLLALRRDDRVWQDRRDDLSDGIVLGDSAFAFRLSDGARAERLILVNLGRELAFRQSPDPLLAPPEGGGWRLIWSSESVRYGGGGIAPVEPNRAFRLPGSIALVFASSGANGLEQTGTGSEVLRGASPRLFEA
jgi:maltooligosyltrehalose trehalohydrolase